MVLSAVIDTNGQIPNYDWSADIRSWFPGAIAAVKLWRYKPYLLNGATGRGGDHHHRDLLSVVLRGRVLSGSARSLNMALRMYLSRFGLVDLGPHWLAKWSPPQTDPFFGGRRTRRASRPLVAGAVLLCALAGCFTTTFTKWPEPRNSSTQTWKWKSRALSGAAGHQDPTSTKFSFVPGLKVSSEDQLEIGLTLLLRRAKSVCMISRAITVPQTLEPSVEAVRMPVEGWSNQDAPVKVGV